AVASAASKYSVYVLGADLSARGMSDDNIVDGISVVDYDGFVDLVTEHDQVNAWL
ncbi:MAG TPA: sulfurtransferase complex subunit TusB, partial [Gammaproteobacteria bacterium]|nr:sulfurtransferase complex subunit TusB [Gammaproteobacteria bacterium]